MRRPTSNLLDVVAQFVCSLVGRGCYLILQVFLARRLGPNAFGMFAIGWTVVGLAVTLVPIGMTTAMVRYGVGGRSALHARPIRLAAVVGLAVTGLLILGAGPIARLVFHAPDAAPVLVALAPSVLLGGVFAVLSSALRASNANLASAVLGAMAFAVGLALTALAFGAGLPPTGATAGAMYSASIAVGLVPAIWLLYRLPAQDGSPALRPLLRFGVVIMLISSANLLNLWADRIVIGVMADARSVGIYQVASQLAVVALVLRSAVVTVFETRVPKQVPGHAPPDVTREFLASTRLLLHTSAPGLLCLIVTAGFWTDRLFGTAYRDAALPLAILTAGQLVVTFAGPAINALGMTGSEGVALRIAGVTCLLNVVGNVVLLPWIGLPGSALAFDLANVASSGTCVFALVRTRRLRLRLDGVRDVLLATLASAVAAALAARWLGASSLVPVAAILAIAYLAYGLTVATLCRTEDEALALVRRTLAAATRQQAPWLRRVR